MWHRKSREVSTSCATRQEASSCEDGGLLTGAGVPLGGARAVEAQRAGGHAHADLLHADPLQVHEEARPAGQAAIVVGAGQAAPLLAARALPGELCGGWRTQLTQGVVEHSDISRQTSHETCGPLGGAVCCPFNTTHFNEVPKHFTNKRIYFCSHLMPMNLKISVL